MHVYTAVSFLPSTSYIMKSVSHLYTLIHNEIYVTHGHTHNQKFPHVHTIEFIYVSYFEVAPLYNFAGTIELSVNLLSV